MNNINNNQIEGMQSSQQQMSPEEMLTDLDQLMSKVQNKYQSFSTQKIQTKNKVQDIQEETMNKVFEILAASGVDGSDPQQVSEFLAQIEKNSPELYQLFSESIASLIGPDEPQGDEGTQPNVEPVEEIGKQM